MNVNFLAPEAQCIADALLLKVAAQNDWPTVITVATIYTKLVQASQAAQTAETEQTATESVDEVLASLNKDLTDST